jgi:hypothetical protein
VVEGYEDVTTDSAQALQEFDRRFTAAWDCGQAASEVARTGADEDTVSHLDWAMSQLARWRLRVLDGEKLPSDPGHLRVTGIVGTADEADPVRREFAERLRELQAFFDDGLGMASWDWQAGHPPQWLPEAQALDGKPWPWDITVSGQTMPMEWRRLPERSADPARPDPALVDRAALRLADLFSTAQREATQRTRARRAPPLAGQAGDALRAAHGDVLAGDWFPGSLMPVIDIRLRVMLTTPRGARARKDLGAPLVDAFLGYLSFVGDERFGLAGWPWSSGPPVGWKAAAMRATAAAST